MAHSGCAGGRKQFRFRPPMTPSSSSFNTLLIDHDRSLQHPTNRLSEGFKYQVTSTVRHHHVRISLPSTEKSDTTGPGCRSLVRSSAAADRPICTDFGQGRSTHRGYAACRTTHPYTRGTDQVSVSYTRDGSRCLEVERHRIMAGRSSWGDIQA